MTCKVDEVDLFAVLTFWLKCDTFMVASLSLYHDLLQMSRNTCDAHPEHVSA